MMCIIRIFILFSCSWIAIFESGRWIAASRTSGAGSVGPGSGSDPDGTRNLSRCPDCADRPSTVHAYGWFVRRTAARLVPTELHFFHGRWSCVFRLRWKSSNRKHDSRLVVWKFSWLFWSAVLVLVLSKYYLAFLNLGNNYLFLLWHFEWGKCRILKSKSAGQEFII